MLPREIIYQILLEAVRVRGTKRAQRLRLVNRAWRAAADEAFITLGEFAHDPKLEYERAPYWSEYTTRTALLLPPEPHPESLRTIRQAAERLARYGNPDTYSDAMLKEYMVEICKMSLVLDHVQAYHGIYSPNDPWWRLLRDWGHGEKENVDQLLLRTAAWTNQVALLRELLSHRGVLLPGDPRVVKDRYARNFALDMAAYRGNNEAVRLLLDSFEGTNRDPYNYHRVGAEKDVLKFASIGNSLSTIELSFTRARYFMDNDPNVEYVEYLMASMARRGIVSILDYLFRLHFPDPTSWCPDSRPEGPAKRSLLLGAAQGGQAEAVGFFLEKGYPVRPGVLVAGVRHENPALVQLFLERSSFEVTSTDTLAIAVRKEDDKVLRMLLDLGPARLDFGRKEGLVTYARRQGLESMEKLLLEHWVE
ncbi:hypothetical protein PG994_003948 [Apiospora phragmitis]|uniref:F-box domain-containing protein n=1 Tax=Apiospora phragmitis TaxID=2905665 RepID=A0ABR1VZJ5_9PEZI